MDELKSCNDSCFRLLDFPRHTGIENRSHVFYYVVKNENAICLYSQVNKEDFWFEQLFFSICLPFLLGDHVKKDAVCLISLYVGPAHSCT